MNFPTLFNISFRVPLDFDLDLELFWSIFKVSCSIVMGVIVKGVYTFIEEIEE